MSIDRGTDDWTLTYNSSGQVIGIARAGDSALSYEYDALGRRTGAVDGSTERDFLVAPAAQRLGAGVLDVEVQHLATNAATGALVNGWVYAGENPILRFEGAPGAEVVSYYLEDASDSVAALLNAGGAVVAEYEYDAFGNSLNGVNPTSAAGGDFGYHGAWRDAETGLYHMRARTYDPQTGRFTTPDPATPNPQVPETYEPYSFANNNPHLYSDPTGLFSIVEINVTGVIQSSLQNLRSIAVNEARKFAVQEAQEAAVDFLVDTLMKLTPWGSQLRDVLDFVQDRDTGAVAGDFFEDLVSDLMCDSIGQFLPDALRFFPRLAVSDGRAITDGIGCGQLHRGLGGDINDVPGNDIGERTARPDYLLTSGAPTDGDLTYILGDVKLTGARLVKEYGGASPINLPQFQAIMNHAKNRGLRVGVFFTITPIPKAKLDALAEVIKKSAIQHGAFAFVVSVL